MIQLLVYLASAGLVVIGSLGFIAALSIPGRIRSFLACLAASVPIGVGIWLFRSSGLHLTDFGRLVQASAGEAQQLVQALKETQHLKGSLDELLR